MKILTKKIIFFLLFSFIISAFLLLLSRQKDEVCAPLDHANSYKSSAVFFFISEILDSFLASKDDPRYASIPSSVILLSDESGVFTDNIGEPNPNWCPNSFKYLLEIKI